MCVLYMYVCTFFSCHIQAIQFMVDFSFHLPRSLFQKCIIRANAASCLEIVSFQNEKIISGGGGAGEQSPRPQLLILFNSE